MNVQENYEQWLKDFADDQETVRELESIRNDAAEIEDRFYTELSFGTAGMREHIRIEVAVAIEALARKQ